MTTRAVVVQMEVYTVDEVTRAVMTEATLTGKLPAREAMAVANNVMARLRGERP